MAEKQTRPTKGAGHELSTDQGSSSVEAYDGPVECCTVCGKPDTNLSIPFGRCLPCIKAGSAAWQAKAAARSKASAAERERKRKAARLRPGHDDRPLWRRELWPLAEEVQLDHDNRPLFDRMFWPLPEVRPEPARRGQPHRATTSARFRGLLTTLNDAGEGTRNTVLHWVACRVGEMIADGELHDPRRAADTLTDVALNIGLTPTEIAGTIRSGLSKSGVTL